MAGDTQAAWCSPGMKLLDSLEQEGGWAEPGRARAHARPTVGSGFLDERPVKGVADTVRFLFQC